MAKDKTPEELRAEAAEARRTAAERRNEPPRPARTEEDGRTER